MIAGTHSSSQNAYLSTTSQKKQNTNTTQEQTKKIFENIQMFDYIPSSNKILHLFNIDHITDLEDRLTNTLEDISRLAARFNSQKKTSTINSCLESKTLKSDSTDFDKFDHSKTILSKEWNNCRRTLEIALFSCQKELIAYDVKLKKLEQRKTEAQVALDERKHSLKSPQTENTHPSSFISYFTKELFIKESNDRLASIYKIKELTELNHAILFQLKSKNSNLEDNEALYNKTFASYCKIESDKSKKEEQELKTFEEHRSKKTEEWKNNLKADPTNSVYKIFLNIVEADRQIIKFRYQEIEDSLCKFHEEIAKFTDFPAIDFLDSPLITRLNQLETKLGALKESFQSTNAALYGSSYFHLNRMRITALNLDSKQIDELSSHLYRKHNKLFEDEQVKIENLKKDIEEEKQKLNQKIQLLSNSIKTLSIIWEEINQKTSESKQSLNELQSQYEKVKGEKEEKLKATASNNSYSYNPINWFVNSNSPNTDKKS